MCNIVKFRKVWQCKGAFLFISSTTSSYARCNISHLSFKCHNELVQRSRGFIYRITNSTKSSRDKFCRWSSKLTTKLLNPFSIFPVTRFWKSDIFEPNARIWCSTVFWCRSSVAASTTGIFPFGRGKPARSSASMTWLAGSAPWDFRASQYYFSTANSRSWLPSSCTEKSRLCTSKARMSQTNFWAEKDYSTPNLLNASSLTYYLYRSFASLLSSSRDFVKKLLRKEQHQKHGPMCQQFSLASKCASRKHH